MGRHKTKEEKPRKFFRLTEDDRNDVIRMHNEGVPSNVIADYIGCCTVTVNRTISRMLGLTRKRSTWSEEQDRSLIRCWNAGWDIKDICIVTRKSQDSVYSRTYTLRAQGIQINRRHDRR